MIAGCSPEQPGPRDHVQPAAQDDEQPAAQGDKEPAARDDFEKQVEDYLQKFPYQETYRYAMVQTGGDPAS
jgi:hypothetical protein